VTRRAAILLLCIPLLILAQRTSVRIPFAGCKSDGQVGPIDASKGTSKSVPIVSEAAQKVSYYKSQIGLGGLGVLAPRGWYCFGLYGSGGDTLIVSPQPISKTNIFSPDWIAYTGPAIVLHHSFGETSGRFDVADIIARVFPADKSFATKVMEEFDQPANTYTFGPCSNDILHYKSDTVVEYKTPAQTAGDSLWPKEE
jgi:hypothetical protein